MRDACIVGKNCFSLDQLITMERLVLVILNYECSQPTAATFIGHYLADMKGDLEFQAIAKYIACLSLTDYENLHFQPSMVAASAVFLACQIQKTKLPSKIILEKWTGCANEAMECVKRLDWLQKQIVKDQKQIVKD
eukprot:c16022_g1_i1 orf=113-520(-)